MNRRINTRTRQAKRGSQRPAVKKNKIPIKKQREREQKRRSRRREARKKLVETHSVLLEKKTISSFRYVLRMAKIYPTKIISKRRRMVPAKKLLAFFEITEKISSNKRQYKNIKLTEPEFDLIKKFCKSREISFNSLTQAIEELYSNIDKINLINLRKSEKHQYFSLTSSDFFVDRQPGKKFVFTVSHR